MAPTKLPPKDILKTLYTKMLLVRKVEEKIVELYPEQEMRCPVHLCIGQEAVPVGICANLFPTDYVLSAHRSHGHYLAKGGDLNSMMAELYGKKTGCSGGNGGSMHLVDIDAGFLGSTPIVGSTIPIAVGVAFASVLRKEKRTVAVFLGEAATEEGVFHESVNFAKLKNLPVLLVQSGRVRELDPADLLAHLYRSRLGIPASWGVQGLLFEKEGKAHLVLFASA